MFTSFGFNEQITPNSSAIRDVYYANNREAVIVFSTGYAYLFSNVAREDFRKFLKVSSAGRYYNDEFAPKYQSADRVDASRVSFLKVLDKAADQQSETPAPDSASKKFTIEFQLNGNTAKHVVEAVDTLQAMGVFNALVKGFGASVTDKKVVIPFG